jgi:EPS-associated MarR family transcriptional regulator
LRQGSAVACMAELRYGTSCLMTNQELEYRALKILEQQPDLTQRQLAKELGVSLGKTHYLVKSLIDVGWVKLDNFQKSNNKWGYAYLLTPMGIAEKAAITAQFLLRKQREYNELRQEIAQLQKEVLQQQELNDK